MVDYGFDQRSVLSFVISVKQCILKTVYFEKVFTFSNADILHVNIYLS